MRNSEITTSNVDKCTQTISHPLRTSSRVPAGTLNNSIRMPPSSPTSQHSKRPQSPATTKTTGIDVTRRYGSDHFGKAAPSWVPASKSVSISSPVSLKRPVTPSKDDRSITSASTSISRYPFLKRRSRSLSPSSSLQSKSKAKDCRCLDRQKSQKLHEGKSKRLHASSQTQEILPITIIDDVSESNTTSEKKSMHHEINRKTSTDLHEDWFMKVLEMKELHEAKGFYYRSLQRI